MHVHTNKLFFSLANFFFCQLNLQCPSPLMGLSWWAQMVKNMFAIQKTQVWSLGQEDPLEKGMATHSSILALRIPWTEEPGGLQSMGPQRVGHNWSINIFTFSPIMKIGRGKSLPPQQFDDEDAMVETHWSLWKLQLRFWDLWPSRKKYLSLPVRLIDFCSGTK